MYFMCIKIYLMVFFLFIKFFKAFISAKFIFQQLKFNKIKLISRFLRKYKKMALVTNIPITSATIDNMSRNEYLLWVNECLQSEFSKIEQLHTGAGYCLFTEILFPGNIGMKRVKFNSRLELDWLSNWKIVQTSWKNLGIEKVIPVEKLIKGKFQDNFEFLQWFKKFFDVNYDGHEYNPLEMRNFEELPKENKLKPGGLLRQPQQLQQKNAIKPTVTPIQQRAGSNVSMNSTGATSSGYKKPSAVSTMAAAANKKPSVTMANSTGRASAQTQPKAAPPQQQQSNASAQQQKQLLEEIKNKDQQIEELRNQVAETDDVVGGLEKERDFYFAKLRKIEVICQENEVVGTLAVNDVLQILYETEEGFAAPEDADIVVGSNGGDYANEKHGGSNGHEEY